MQSCSHKWASVQKCAEARFFMAPVCEAPCKATSLRGRRDAVGGFDVTVRGLWKTTSLWHAPRTGMPLRLIRSLKLCCPRPASWSTNLQRYNTFRQPGLRPACQKVVHAYREIAARASPSPHRFASPHIATSTRLVEFPLNMACPPLRRFCKSLPARWIQDRDKFSGSSRISVGATGRFRVAGAGNWQ